MSNGFYWLQYSPGWGCLVASNKALNLLYQVMHAVSYWRTSAANKTASKVGPFVHPCFVCCRPGGRWGNTEQVVTQWWHPLASRETPGNAALGNTSSIVLKRLHGHQNGLQRRCMCLLLLLFYLILNIAKDHVMAYYK